ncbi:MAG: hypothetical protein HYT37_00020 [Candidatus Sungbacteria bacterium]|nr:hypothetical protein [Candidatus Sungbacteria bacterium]
MDQTGVMVLLFVVLKTLLWVGVVLWAFVISRRAYAVMKETQNFNLAMTQHFKSVVVWFVVFVLAVVVTGIESGYRPKTILKPVRPYHEERIQEDREKSAPSIVQTPPRQTWEDIQEKNRKENEEARRAFESLPDAEK